MHRWVHGWVGVRACRIEACVDERACACMNVRFSFALFLTDLDSRLLCFSVALCISLHFLPGSQGVLLDLFFAFPFAFSLCFPFASALLVRIGF